MLASHPVRLALGVACLSLACASSALAAGPATVTVRVEGATQTLVPPTQVTTTTGLVVKDGKPEDACPGTNAVGALELATAGNWSGRWFGGGINKEGKFEGGGYFAETVAGESHSLGSGSYWDVWYNNKEAAEGLCKAEMQAGDQVLLFPCVEEAPCPIPLGIEAPPSADIGEPVAVAVKKYNEKGEASPAVGATITGGAAPATADSSGHATLTFPNAGESQLRVTAPGLVRTETSVCVHAGNDGTCGTTAPSTSGTPAAAGSGTLGAKTFVGAKAIVAELTGLIDGHHYRRGDAPRVLAGSVTAPSAVASISLRLRRTYRGRCWSYDGKRERFLRVRCRRGSFFRVAPTGDSFSYLLPSRLQPGRYVLDVEATDAAGNHTTLVRGTSRIVFYVA
jgi:hypothetical protein